MRMRCINNNNNNNNNNNLYSYSRYTYRITIVHNNKIIKKIHNQSVHNAFRKSLDSEQESIITG